MIIAQAGLGLRIAELLALRLEDIDFPRRTVRVEYQLTQDGKRRVDPKTPKSRRTLPLPAHVGLELSEHIRPARQPTPTAPYSPRPAAICTGKSITKLGSSVPAACAAGLPNAVTHDLRHHYASVLLHAGESVATVAKLRVVKDEGRQATPARFGPASRR
jgi:integrase